MFTAESPRPQSQARRKAQSSHYAIDLAPFRAMADKVYGESDMIKAWDAAKLKQVIDTK